MDKACGYFKRHMVSQSPISILFIDIDFFKQINDQYGHQAGDEVLKQLAQVIQESIRPTDLCCRYGGEEFLVLLNETNEDQTLYKIKELGRNKVALYEAFFKEEANYEL